MPASPILRDERTEFTENVSYRWAYLLLSYGLLASIAYRGFVTHESSWDLLTLVIAAGVVATFYQARHRVLSFRWGVITVAGVVLATAIAAAMMLLS